MVKRFKSFTGCSRLIGACFALFCGAAHAATINANECGALTNAFGPFDYRNAADRQNLPIVENHHFTPQVEALIKGREGRVGADIDYTLRAFPNHLRALAAMARLSVQEKTSHPNGANYSVECYFERAMRFRPKDGFVHMVYGEYLDRMGNIPKSIAHFQEAVQLEPNNADACYNLGLMYLKQKDYVQARIYARKAYALGFPLSGLKKKLAEAGEWDAQP